jgi:hypothetical protein
MTFGVRHSGMVREHQTSDAQLRIGESLDSGFDASQRPGMTESGLLRGAYHRARVRDLLHSLNRSALIRTTGSDEVFSAQWSTSVLSVSTSPAL